MRRGREFIGLPVVDGETKQRLGEVCDLRFTEDGRLRALVVTASKGLLRRERVFPVEAFERIGPEGAHLRCAAEKWVGCHEGAWGALSLAEKKGGLLGRRLVDEDGRELGVVSDVILDPDPYALWGFEVSDGILRDILDGRPIVDAGGSLIEEERIVLRGGSTLGEGHMNSGDDGHPTVEGSDDA